jgi:F0F1-type ATP synthase assembly protein I
MMDKKQQQKYTHSFKYMGLGFQLIIIVFLFITIGLQIDKKTNSKDPLGLVVMSIIGVFVALYYIIKDVSKKK